MEELLNIFVPLIIVGVVFLVIGAISDAISDRYREAKGKRIKERVKRQRILCEIALNKIKKDFPEFEQDVTNFCDYLNRLNKETHSSLSQIISILQFKEELNTPVTERMLFNIKEKYKAFLNYRWLSYKREAIVDQLIKIVEMKKRTPEYWKKLSPDLFEKEVLNLFKKLCYKTTGTPYGADGGIDGILEKADKKIIIQCKKHKKPIGVKVVREIYGTILHNKANEGWVISISNYTQNTYEFAKGKPIRLIGLEELLNFASTAFPVANDKVYSGLSNQLTSISKAIEERHGNSNLDILMENERNFILCIKLPFLFTKKE